MKTKTTILFLTLSLMSFAQDDYNKWSIDIGAGINKTWLYSGSSNLGLPQVNIGGRYMLNNNFGLKLGVDYNRFKNKEIFTPTNMYSVTGSAVTNLGHVLHFESFAPKLGLLMNIGAGASFLSFNSAQNTDKMLHGTIGFSPQFKITSKISVNLNLSTTINILQRINFDGSTSNVKTGFDGMYSNLGAGVSINLGKKSEHADWTPIELGEKNLPIDNSMAEANTARIKALEDSIANMQKMSDKDGDGVADQYDDCPNEAGKFSDNGCPNADSDGDGVNDLQDNCPEIAGVLSNNGCPEVNIDVKEVMNTALKGVQFKAGKAVLLKRSDAVLKNVVTVMKQNPSYFLNVFGYSDNSGDDVYNLKLSKDRANAVSEFLVANGVEANRLHVEGFGNTNPISNNDHDWGRALNRRVEFKVVFK